MQRGSRKGYLRCTRLLSARAIFGSRAPRKRAAEELEREFPVESGISGGDVPSCYTNLAKLQDRRVEVPPNACAEKLLIDLGVIEFRRQFWSADPILTAVYDNCLPGDECCIVTGKKQDRTGYVPGLSEPLDGLLFPGETLLLFRLRPDCLGICQTGQNRVERTRMVEVGFPSLDTRERPRTHSWLPVFPAFISSGLHTSTP